MEIAAIDLGICAGYEYAGDASRTAIVLPGAMLGGMPVNAYVVSALVDQGWRVIQVWDDYSVDIAREEWAISRARAALDYAGEVRLLTAKSITTHAAPLVSERELAAIWLTPSSIVPNASRRFALARRLRCSSAAPTTRPGARRSPARSRPTSSSSRCRPRARGDRALPADRRLGHGVLRAAMTRRRPAAARSRRSPSAGRAGTRAPHRSRRRRRRPRESRSAPR